MKSLDRRLSALESSAPAGDRQAADAILRSLTDDELERLEDISMKAAGDISRLTADESAWLTDLQSRKGTTDEID